MTEQNIIKNNYNNFSMKKLVLSPIKLSEAGLSQSEFITKREQKSIVGGKKTNWCITECWRLDSEWQRKVVGTFEGPHCLRLYCNDYYGEGGWAECECEEDDGLY